MTILEEAQKAVYGDRQSDYGTVTENFNTIAKLWSGVLKIEVTAEQVGLCMVQVKVARQMYKPKRDNLVDGAGYFATLEKMEDENRHGIYKTIDAHIPFGNTPKINSDSKHYNLSKGITSINGVKNY